MDYSICLRQVHQLFSGLFVSSASDGKIADSLDILLTPKHISRSEFADLNAAANDLLMCGFKNPVTGKLEWCSYRHQELMKGKCEAYALSGLSAFPLPIWPFFGDSNPSLNVFMHFAEYLPAYHPSFIVERPSEASIKIIDGDDILFVAFVEECHFLFSVFTSTNSVPQISLYRKGLGACIIDSGVIGTQACPIKSFGKLDRLQYAGNVNYCRFDKSTVNLSLD